MRHQIKRIKSAIILVLTLAATLMSSAAWAHRGGGWGGGGHGYHHGGTRVGVYIGAPVFGFPYYGYPGYGFGDRYGYGYGNSPYGDYGPATVVVTAPAAPVTYVEQNTANTRALGNPAGPASDGYWYYCSSPDGYYPYVKQCAIEWQKVPSQPASR